MRSLHRVLVAALLAPGLFPACSDSPSTRGAGAATAPDDATAAETGIALLDVAGAPGPDDTLPPADTGPRRRCPSDGPLEPGQVRIEQGVVGGIEAGGSWSWRGIPYAAAPAGERRLRPPEDAPCLAAPLDASAFGPPCPQADAKTGAPLGAEDCLHLNVWAPAGATQAEPRPVMVFIHGGGNIQGSASQALAGGAPIYGGRRLADAGDAVVVTLNYRLGALGFLALPEMADDGGQMGNFGILDQIAALRWVRSNIRGFGGDADRVMVFGESAGAVDTCVLLASPRASGLFSAALMESGGCTATPGSDASAAMAAKVAGTSCGAASDRMACLRALPVETLLAELPGDLGTVFSTTVAADPGRFQPIVDGQVLAEAPLAAIAAGRHNAVPLVVGSNAEELAETLPVGNLTAAAYESALQASFGALGAAAVASILAAYPAAAYPTPRAALVAVFSDLRFTCPTRWVARAAAASQEPPVFRYWFRRRATLPNGQKPAAHGVELLYVFGTLHDIPLFVPAAEDGALSAAMMRYWSRFGRGGDPTGGDDPLWPPYAGGTDPHLVLDAPLVAAEGVRTAQCDLWDGIAAKLGLQVPGAR